MMADNKDKYTHHSYYNLLMDDTHYKPTLIRTTKHYKHYVSNVGKDNDLSVTQYLLLIAPHIPTLINRHKNESNKWNIQLIMQICFINPNERSVHPPCLSHCDEEVKPEGMRHIVDVYSDVEEIRSDVETSEII